MSELTDLLAKRMEEADLATMVVGGEPALNQLLQEAEMTRQLLLALSQQVDALAALVGDLRGGGQ